MWSKLVFINPFYNTHSIFPFSSESITACYGSLPSGVTQTFLPERPGTLAVLLELGYCSGPLILTTGHASAKKYPKGSPVLKAYSSLPPLWNSSPNPP